MNVHFLVSILAGNDKTINENNKKKKEELFHYKTSSPG
jgi:hypothetical protein